jgi:hypothetical protein
MWKSYSELIAAKLAYTDSRGQYTIPRVSTNMGLSSVLEETIVIIYEPGYQAYIQRINHISPERKTDRPFQEKNNPVNLERIPPYFNYSDHYSGIDRAMGGLREPPMVYPHEVGSKMPWSKIMETQLKFLPEREEFLRRIEWERRRPVEERR